MPRIPIRQQNQPHGSVNTAVPGRVIPLPVIRQSGPAMALEQFMELDPNTRRALHQVQQNVAAAFRQVKAMPMANGNLLEGVALTNGGAGGAVPYNTLNHGLGQPYRGYHILGVRNGAVIQHSVIANANPTNVPVSPLDSAQIRIWTLISAFGASPVLADIWVYA